MSEAAYCRKLISAIGKQDPALLDDIYAGMINMNALLERCAQANPAFWSLSRQEQQQAVMDETFRALREREESKGAE